VSSRPSAARRAAALAARDREIWRLAVPALGALIAEPVFQLADAAIVGHLGAAQLAGFGAAAAALATLVNVCIFLAYGTTSAVARRMGAGDLRAPQIGMAAAYAAVAVRAAGRHRAHLRPDVPGIRASAGASFALLVRTAALRAYLLVAVWAAARSGTAALAAHTVASNLWNTLALALDALAIAAQAIVGHALGAGDAAAARSATRRMSVWASWPGWPPGRWSRPRGRCTCRCSPPTTRCASCCPGCCCWPRRTSRCPAWSSRWTGC